MALVAVTPSDSVALATPIRRLYAGGTGAIAVIDTNGNTVVFNAVPAAMWIDFFMSPISQVKATGTTATGIVGDTNGR